MKLNYPGLEWPYNFLAAMTNDPNYLEHNPIPVDLLPSVHFVIGTVTPREQRIVYEYYLYGKTLSDLSDEFGVTTGYIRQIIGRIAQNMEYVHKGLCAVESDKIKNAYKYGYERGLHDKDRATNDDAQTGVRHEPNDDTVFRDLGLSARAYNGVVRHAALPNNIFGRIYSRDQDIPLFEFVGVSESDIMSIRNMGRKSYSELIVALSEHGIILNNGIFCREHGYERGLLDTDRATNDDAVVRCLGLPARPYNCIVYHAASPNNIFGQVYSKGQDIPLSEFVGVSESDLRRIRNMTVKTCSQVIVALSEHGIVLKDGVFCRND